MSGEILFLFCMSGCGAVVGLLAKCGPRSGWQAVLSAALLPPIAIGLSMTFC